MLLRRASFTNANTRLFKLIRYDFNSAIRPPGPQVGSAVEDEAVVRLPALPSGAPRRPPGQLRHLDSGHSAQSRNAFCVEHIAYAIRSVRIEDASSGLGAEIIRSTI